MNQVNQIIYNYIKGHPKSTPSEIKEGLLATHKIDVKSIGVIRTNILKPYWDVNKNFVNTTQYNLFEDVSCIETSIFTKDQYLKESRISFNDLDGSHDLQLNDWQYYEYQRKFGAKKDAFRYINNQIENCM